MPKKRTILKHEDSSKETYDTKSYKLSDKVRLRKFGVEYDAGKVGKFKAGLIKGARSGTGAEGRYRGMESEKRPGIGWKIKF